MPFLGFPVCSKDALRLCSLLALLHFNRRCCIFGTSMHHCCTNGMAPEVALEHEQCSGMYGHIGACAVTVAVR
eukprot:1158947-Pelagomonas_calceolata.AAC.7